LISFQTYKIDAAPLNNLRMAEHEKSPTTVEDCAMFNAPPSIPSRFKSVICNAVSTAEVQ
jgi:hypothetical protein